MAINPLCTLDFLCNSVVHQHMGCLFLYHGAVFHPPSWSLQDWSHKRCSPTYYFCGTMYWEPCCGISGPTPYSSKWPEGSGPLDLGFASVVWACRDSPSFYFFIYISFVYIFFYCEQGILEICGTGDANLSKTHSVGYPRNRDWLVMLG